jgi:hypothetical protein
MKKDKACSKCGALTLGFLDDLDFIIRARRYLGAEMKIL